MAASACLTMGLLQLVLWLHRRSAVAHAWLALAATAAGANAFAELTMLRTDRVDSYVLALRLSDSAVTVLVISMVWFVVFDFGTARRWLAVSLTVLWAVMQIPNLRLPYGKLLGRISSLERRSLPWGETFPVLHADQTVWSTLSGFAGLLFIGFVADAAWRLWSRGGRRHALVIGGSTVVFLGAAAIHAPLVDRALVETPYLISFAFLGVVLAMGLELTRDVARAAELSATVESSERRWRSLLENVQLLVVGGDGSGRVDYVNPFFLEVTGQLAGDVLGRPFREIVGLGQGEGPVDEPGEPTRQDVSQAFELGIRGRDGDERTVSWSNVPQRDPAGRVTGALSIGADVTERRKAETSRDEALARVQASLREVEALKSRLEEEVVYLQDEIKSVGRFAEIVGNSDALRYVLRRVEQVAPLDTTVLIEGETGVGKELVARALHARSRRSRRPMVRVDCATLPPSLIEAELFGHEKGAFTSAIQARRGRFELADGGTIFLDEIGELPLELQGRLLRVIQEGEFERVGGTATNHVNLRVIAATNRKLAEEVERGGFREDLYYRLRVFPITVPPLRQRREDIPLLVEAFVRRFSQAQGKSIDRIPGPVMEELCSHDWPGNVRELSNVIERAVIQAHEGTLRLEERLTVASGGGPRSTADAYRGTLQDIEREYVLQVLEMAGWRIDGEGGAAMKLGLHPNTLRFRMGKLGISRPVAAR